MRTLQSSTVATKGFGRHPGPLDVLEPWSLHQGHCERSEAISRVWHEIAAGATRPRNDRVSLSAFFRPFGALRGGRGGAGDGWAVERHPLHALTAERCPL